MFIFTTITRLFIELRKVVIHYFFRTMVVFIAKGYRWIPHCLIKLDFLSIRKIFFNHFHVRFVETATYNHYCDDKVQKSSSIKNKSQVAKITFTFHIIWFNINWRIIIEWFQILKYYLSIYLNENYFVLQVFLLL